MMNRKKYIKKGLCFMLVISSVFVSGCSGNKNMPEKHSIEYPDNLGTLEDDEGADSYHSLLDSTEGKYYTANDYYNMKSQDTLHIISNFETYQQTLEYTCGSAALLMVLHYYGNDDYDEMEITDISGADPHHGTFVEGMCQFLDAAGYEYECHIGTDEKFETTEEASQFFVDCIDKGIPVIVDSQDWGGHWQVVIGVDTCSSLSVDDDVIIFADPYDVTDQYQDGYYTYSLSRFVKIWREGTCADKEVPYEQPYITVKSD